MRMVETEYLLKTGQLSYDAFQNFIRTTAIRNISLSLFTFLLDKYIMSYIYGSAGENNAIRIVARMYPSFGEFVNWAMKKILYIYSSAGKPIPCIVLSLIRMIL